MTSTLGLVRLLIADTDPTRQILTDTDIVGYLTLAGAAPTGHLDAAGAPIVDATTAQVRYAAADALDAIATSEALVLKVIRTQDLQTDGAKLADTLMKRAAALRVAAKQAEDDAVEEAATAAGGFGVVAFEPYPRGW